jgi:hypothetical protein
MENVTGILTSPNFVKMLTSEVGISSEIFPISGISYELQRLASKFPDNKLITAIITPGLLYQHITTTEPEDDILEIGLVSLGKAIALEKKNKKTPIIGVGEETYENFEMFFKTVNREE